MPRVRSQLALQLPPELIARIRAEARARGQTITVMVAGWLEAALEAPGAGLAGDDLADRVTALEAAVAQLQARPAPAPAAPVFEEVAPSINTRALLPDRRLTPAEAAGLLTTPEVGQALGLASDSALTNWIAREASKRGGSAVGGVYRGHRLRGKGLLPGGQKPGWLWEPA